MLFYVPFLIYASVAALFRSEFTVYLSQFINIFHFSVAFAGFYVWIRWRGAARGFALCLALAATFCGTWIANAQHAGLIAALSWLPWLFLNTERLIEQPTPQRVVLVAISLSLIMTSGFLPIVFTIYACWAIFSAIVIVQRLYGLPERKLRVDFLGWCGASLVAAQVLNLALTAPFWLPIVLAGVANVTLTTQGPSDSTALLTFFSPGALRSFSLQRYVGIGDVTSTYHFAGLVPFLAIALIWKPTAALRNAPIVSAIVFFVLSRNFAGEANILQGLPLLGVLYRPHLFEAGVVPLLVVGLAGLSIDDVRRLAIPGLAIFVAGLAGLALYAAAIKQLDIDIVALAVMLAAALLSLVWLRFLPARQMPVAFLALAIGPFLFHAFKNNQIWISRTRPNSFTATTVNHGFSDLLAVLKSGNGLYRVAIDQEIMGGPWNGAWRVWKIETINGFEPNLELIYGDYLTDGFAAWSTNRTFGRLDPSSPKFDALNVRYAVMTEANARGFANHPDWHLVHDSYYRVFERGNVTPRFRAENDACATFDDVIVRRSQPGRQLLAINAKCPQTDILASERPHRHWQVLVDGHAVAWEAINPAHGMRFQVPAGAHTVELRYRTPGLAPAFGVSALAMAGAAAILVRSRRRKKLI